MRSTPFRHPCQLNAYEFRVTKPDTMSALVQLLLGNVTTGCVPTRAARPSHAGRSSGCPLRSELAGAMAAVRVSIRWFGTRKSLTVEQKAEAAEPVGADARFLSAGRRLLDVSHPAFKAITAVRGKVIGY